MCGEGYFMVSSMVCAIVLPVLWIRKYIFRIHNTGGMVPTPCRSERYRTPSMIGRGGEGYRI
jgi:hypothetical protein